MPKEKFTAGPWVKMPNDSIVNRSGAVIMQFDTDVTGQITAEQKEANMQLASATTDMYQFIKDLYENAQRNNATYPELEKVYNKALGINV
jgi:hypothetical protein